MPRGTVRLTIRRAEPEDARQLARLERQIYREDLWFVGDAAPSESSLRHRLATHDPGESLWLLAAHDRVLLGWLELHRLPAKRLNHVATLTLAVAAESRRLGVARRLMSGGYDWARSVGVRKISLNVRAGNTAAIRLYESEGFVLEGREREHIRNDHVRNDHAQHEKAYEDNLIMALFLDR